MSISSRGEPGSEQRKRLCDRETKIATKRGKQRQTEANRGKQRQTETETETETESIGERGK